jgi:hypothetical protein
MPSRVGSCGVAALALGLLAFGCSRAGSEERRSSAAGPGTGLPAKGAGAGPAVPVGALRFTPYRCVDSEGIGIEAFSVLLPAGWRFDGGIRWRLDNPAFPAYAACRLSDPGGLGAFEVFPNLPYFWTNNPTVAGMFPPGSKYFGSTVRRPVGAEQALRELVLPAFRVASGLAITGGGAVPELAAMVQEMQARAQPEANVRADAAKVRFRYVDGGRAVEEEMYAVVQMFSFPLATMSGTVTNVNWWVDYVFSFRAGEGQLDASARLLQTVAFSFRVNPRWFAAYSNVVQYLIRRQIQQIRTIGEIGRIYAQTGSEIREDQMRSWEANQAIRDRMSKEWSQAFRGVDEYYDPFAEKPVELPSGYDNAWVNNLGEYVVSESPSYDPNVGSNLTWRPMKKN